MKNLPIFVLTSLFLILYSLLISVPPSPALTFCNPTTGVDCATCSSTGAPCCLNVTQPGDNVCNESAGFACNVPNDTCYSTAGPTTPTPTTAPCNQVGQDCCVSIVGTKTCDRSIEPNLKCDLGTSKCVIEICGQLGQNCCQNGPVCTVADLKCDYFNSPSRCVSLSCGNQTQSCCPGDTCNNPTLSCQGGSCVYTAGDCETAGGGTCGYAVCASGFHPDPTWNCTVGVCCMPGSSSGTPPDPWCGGVTGIVSTGLGCLFAGNPAVAIGSILWWGIYLGGGIAFLMIVYAGFQMATAAGDPKRVKASQELLMAALGGLILIVISIALLNFLGVTVLGLNRFGFNVLNP